MALLGLPLVELSLALRGYVATRGWIERNTARAVAIARVDAAALIATDAVGGIDARAAGPAATTSITALQLAAAQRTAALVAIAGRNGPIAATCLRQSLLVWWLLRRRGVDARLQLGVRRTQGAVDAHAWVELDGVALAPGPIEHQAFKAHP